MKKLLLIASFMVLVSGVFAIRAEAATVTLSGYAWSENVGWFHFKGANYGVTVDSVTGVMSGDAWSENVGWMTFNAGGTAVNNDLTGCPSGTCNAAINIGTGAVTGWAKVLSTNTWVHLAGGSYGVTYSNGASLFAGYAWGDTDVGWLHFAGANYAVQTDASLTPPPTAPSGLSATTISQSQINLAWTDNSNNETGFKVERKTGVGGVYAQINLTAANAVTYPDTGLGSATQYCYRIRATNAGGDSTYEKPAADTCATTLSNTATINVTISPIGAQSATWTISPGALNGGPGNGSKVVNPSGGGTSYSINNLSSVPGYGAPTCVWNDGHGGSNGACSGLLLFGGETASFAVTYTPAFNFSLPNNLGNVSITKAGVPRQVTVPVQLNLTQAPTAPVYLDFSVTPAFSGVSAQYSNQPCSPDCSNTVTFTAQPTATETTYQVTISGAPTSGGPTKFTNQFNLTILPADHVYATCTANPAIGAVGQDIAWTAVGQGGTAPYTFTAWTGNEIATSPAPDGSSMTAIYTTTGNKQADVTVRDSLNNVGHCEPVGSVTIGVNPIFQEF